MLITQVLTVQGIFSRKVQGEIQEAQDIEKSLCGNDRRIAQKYSSEIKENKIDGVLNSK